VYNACLFSGGKDSTLALHKAIASGLTIDMLITFQPENDESYMFHYPNIRFTKLQAEALGIRQVIVETKGEKEKELEDLEGALVDNKIALLVTGATYSNYQAGRINAIAERRGIRHVAPLWHVDPHEELEEIARDYEAIITSVAAEGLDDTFLGKTIDKEMIARLDEANRKYGISILFEGGEAESFVIDAPLFKRRIEIKEAKKEWNGRSGKYIIQSAALIDK